MGVLNPWQRIDRVLPGKPFGDGRDGALTISGNTNQSLTTQSCSGTSGNTTLTLASGAFTNGDVVLIHQTRGTGAGQWEVNQVISGGGTATLVMKKSLQYTYTDSGASQAQVIKIPMYSDVTVNNGVTLNGTDWDGNVGGFIILAAKGITTISGTIDHKGTNNPNSSSAVRGGGFEGGYGKQFPGSGTYYGRQGEGTAGPGGESGAANGNGGGGGRQSTQPDGNFGAGGGNGAAGGNGTALSGQPAATGGSPVGTSDLTNFCLGGGGGGGVKEAGFTGAGGGSGGGGLFMFTKEIEITGTITLVGGKGADASGSIAVGGGGGAGGSCLIACVNATLGSALINASGGAGGYSNYTFGGAGSVGRIAIHHSGTVTGTTNPTFTDVTDATLKESGGVPNLLIFESRISKLKERLLGLRKQLENSFPEIQPRLNLLPYFSLLVLLMTKTAQK